jgi:hypothetical protein
VLVWFGTHDNDATAGTVPTGFEESVVLNGLSQPTAVRFASDGRFFVAKKSGIIKVFDSLTIVMASVADHHSGAIVWGRSGRNNATLQVFSDETGDRKDSIRAISIDMSGEYQRAIRDAVPDAQILSIFRVCRLAAARDRPGPPRRIGTPTSARTQRPAGA